VGVPTAIGVHDDDLFQLDYVTAPTAQGVANVSSANISPAGNIGDDWDEVYAGTSGAFATAFIPDPTGDAETSFYTGGGSKDERPISTGQQHWEWDDTNDVIPDKDDLSDAFAAAYRDPDSGHIIFYFGADRFDTSGDAEVGFWFFRQPVTLDPKPDFDGEHEVGDILVLANWGGSNKVGDIAVYEWIGGNKPLQLLKDTTEADCSVAPVDDPVCAVVNNVGGETPPWSYTNKDGQHSYKATALFEGGIDVSALLGVQDIGCFSSFLAATRSSHSTTAELKDFALGAFPVCGVEVTKTGDTLSKIGDPVDYTITVKNTGQATLYKKSISDSLLGAIATNGVNQANPLVLTNTCGASLAPGATCTITARRTVQAGDPDPLPNTATIVYTEKADFTGLSFTSTDDHDVNLFQPAVTITKEGDGLSKATDPVTYTFTITNKSSQDSPNLTLASVNDNVIGNLKAQADAVGCDTLTYQEDCSFQITRTVDGSDPDPLVNTVDVLYHPVGFPNNVTASDSHSVNLFQPDVSITKNGDELSKVGDDVTYHVKITNTSSDDSPNLVLNSITDDVLGDLSDEAPAPCDSIAPKASCEFDVPWKVRAVDVNPADGQPDDPVINTVTIHFHPDGFPNDITATASHKLNLFQPSIAFAKTADTDLSKVGDDVNYKLTLNNTSSVDTPALQCTITDAKLGVDKQVTLASGAGDVTDVPYIVKASDPDPLVNEASVQCSPTGFPNVLSASDRVTVNLFQPSVDVTKGGDTLSKIGDKVTYAFRIENTGSADSPNLDLVSVFDSVLGSLTAPPECDNLAPGHRCDFSVDYTIRDTDPDPLENTVEVHYHPAGFPNDITDSASHTTNLFQPRMTVDKTGDALSKVSDDVEYKIEICNTSSADSPDLVKDSVIDTLISGVNAAFAASIAPGACESHKFTRTVQVGDPDPLVNTVTAHYHPEDFPNDITGSDAHSTNLFQPSVKLTKTADHAFSKAGDTVKYTVTIANTSSADSPALVLDTFTDSVVTGVTPPAACSALAPSTSCAFDYTYTVKVGDPDPLENTATAHYKPDGFPNDITDHASATVDLVHPAFSPGKVCTTDPVDQGGTASFKITYRNIGDTDLVFTPDQADEGGTASVPAGGTTTITITRPVPAGATSVTNTVTGKVTLAAKYGLSNEFTYFASASCNVRGKAKVGKTVSGQPPAAGQTFTFELRQGASTISQGTVLETKITDASGNISFDKQLDPGAAYQICEWVFPGWNTNLAGDGPLFVPESVIPPSLPNPNVNNLVVCANFTVTSGQTRIFTVDNTPPPGGRALTIGFWKNWASCANSSGKGQKPMLDLALAFASQQTTNPPGGLVVSAQNAGSGWPNYAAAFYLVLKGNPLSTDKNILPAPGCAWAVSLLNKSTIDTGKKMASDPLFNMTAQLVGAQLNRFMGAGLSGITITNIDRAVLLNGKYMFNGITYTKPISAADVSLANCLATQLDNYNNGRTVSNCP
jgi:uncharacterized repeat protein (TIGR01451 family)